VGRPSEYTPERGELILVRLAAGETLRAICRDPDMPVRETIRKWREDFPEFLARYARAREAGFDHLADELIEIADDGTGDVWVDDKGHEHTNDDVIQRSRLRVDARKWLLSKQAPKVYGDKVALEHSTPPGQPIQVQATADP